MFSPWKNPVCAKYVFWLCAYLLTIAMYHRISEPWPFFFCATGLMTVSFFMRRAIEQIVN